MKASTKKILAAIRASAAVIIAIVLLAVTNFGFVQLLGGAQTVTDGGEITADAYVTADLKYVMDICAVENDSTTGEAVAYYAVAPIGNVFTVVRFDASEFDNVSGLQAETIDYLTGESQSMTYGLNVTGTAVDIPVEVDRQFTSWFDTNKEWMSQSGVIQAVDDESIYLNTCMIEADAVGGCSGTAVAVCSIIAAVLVLYALAEVVLIFTVYGKNTGKKKAKAA